MSPSLLKLAEKVIGSVSRDQPADAALRLTLKSRRDLSPTAAARVARAVFTYYRWRSWLKTDAPVNDQVAEALQLADQFAEKPEAISDQDLTTKAVPAWVHETMEVSAAWARSLQTEPKLWLRTRPSQGPTVAAKLQDCIPFGTGSLGDTLRYCGRQDLFLSSAFHAGEFEVQDLSSQAVGMVCAPKGGETWWDACAGEGGKLLHLSDLMQNRGLIWASDRAEWRLRRLKRRTARARVFNYRAVEWDGGARLPTKTKFDGVLLDAPCSGLGTWQRNPHARWTTTPDDVSELSQLQSNLLAHAAAAVKPGGKLIYSVCTLTRAETVQVAQQFQQVQTGFQPWSFAHPLEAEAPAAPQLFLWPQDCGGNGMFIAAWTRTR